MIIERERENGRKKAREKWGRESVRELGVDDQFGLVGWLVEWLSSFFFYCERKERNSLSLSLFL